MSVLLYQAIHLTMLMFNNSTKLKHIHPLPNMCTVTGITSNIIHKIHYMYNPNQSNKIKYQIMFKGKLNNSVNNLYNIQPSL